jgi:HK97 family phage portal protein
VKKINFIQRLLGNIQKKQVQYAYNWQIGRPVWSTQKDEQYLKNAYNKITWVYACVGMIASCTASVPWVLYRKTNNRTIEIEEHPLLKILNMQVNKNCSSKDFFDIWSTYLATQGKFFAELNSEIAPTELYWLYAHKVNPIPNKINFVSGYEYKLGEITTKYNDNKIMWSRFIDPLDAYQGLSPIRTLTRTIDTENEAVDWNKATLQNGAVPPGALSVVNPSPELTEKLRADWLTRYAGATNARVPLVLNAEKASYVNFGLTPVDMDFLNQRKLNRIEICSAFGVPSQIVGDPEGQTYSNYAEALKAFWGNTIIPKYLDNIKDTLNRCLATRYSDNLYIDYNLDDIQALHESKDAIAERVKKLFEGNILKQNEARIALGYDEIEFGNVFLYQLQLQPQSQLQLQPQPIKKKKQTFLNEEEKMFYWKAFDKKREKNINALKNLLRKEFDLERKKVINVIKKSNNKIEMESNIKKEIEKRATIKQEILFASQISTIEEFGFDTFKKLTKIKQINEFNVYENEIQEYIEKTSGQNVVNINETTLESIKLYIQTAFNEGLSIPEIALLINQLYLTQIVPNRSVLIARTEVISASNYGSLQGATQSNVNVKKFWIRTFDSRTRDTHKNAGNQEPIDLEEYFIIGNSKMKFPADFLGEAKEVCNCRCTIGYIEKED